MTLHMTAHLKECDAGSVSAAVKCSRDRLENFLLDGLRDDGLYPGGVSQAQRLDCKRAEHRLTRWNHHDMAGHHDWSYGFSRAPARFRGGAGAYERGSGLSRPTFGGWRR
jgi:hypothetical protein